VDNVTIKGGVVMQHLSGDSRRATQDFDFDFIDSRAFRVG
jgi:hypothetical protein